MKGKRFQKEFYNDADCFYYEFRGNMEPGQRIFYIWHKCSNKLIKSTIPEDSDIHSGTPVNSFGEYGFVCPNCGQPLLHGEKMGGDKYTNFSFTIRRFVGIDIEGLKITIGIVDVVYTLWPQKEKDAYFIVESFSTRFCMNIETGYSYELNTIKLMKNGGLNPKTKRGVKNISYIGSHTELPYDALYYLGHNIEEKMRAFHGEHVPSFASYNAYLSLSNLIFYIRNPFICPVQYNSLLNKSRCEYNGYVVQKRLLIKNNCDNPLQQLFLQNKIPFVKSIKRIVINDLSSFSLLASIACSFKNIDLICALYSAYIDCTDYEGRYVDFSAKVFKKMVECQGEKIVATKLISFKKHDQHNVAFQTLYDTIKCYNEIKNCDFDFKRSYSIDDLHLHLASSMAKQDAENIPLNYTDKEKSLESSDETFSLTLAKDTFELIDVGEAMKICVGGYGRKAIRKDCTILVLRHNDSFSFPVGCIELDKKSVVQAKAPHNHLLNGDKKDFIRKWINDNNLIVRTRDLSDNPAASAGVENAEDIWGGILPF